MTELAVPGSAEYADQQPGLIGVLPERRTPVRWRAALRWLLRPEGLTLLALAAWTAAPLVLQLVSVVRHGGSFTGVQTTYAPDAFQYLSWIRDSGSHLLIGDNFQLVGPSHGVFLQPMLVLSGLLWRLGLSLPLAYVLPWAPAGVLLTFFAFRAYVRRHIPQPSQAVAALVLALFFYSPIAVLSIHTGHWWGGISQLPVDITSSFALWGYFARAISVALVALMMLGLERVIAPSPPVTVRRGRRTLILLAAAGVAISWLHPWQGLEVLIVMAGLTAWSRPGRASLAALAVIAVALILPVIYYGALYHYAVFWHESEQQASAAAFTFSPLTMAFGLMPLGLLALLGIRRRLPTAPHRRILLLWMAAILVVYYALPNKDSLDGLALPLSILAVEGARVLRPGRRWREGGLNRLNRLQPYTVAALFVIAVCTVPGVISELNFFHKNEYNATYGQLFSSDDFQAMSYLEHAPQSGGVLAPLYIASAVPAYTGRNTYTGDFPWTPNFGDTAGLDGQLFAGSIPARRAQDFVSGIHARFLFVDCRDSATQLPGLVAPLIVSAERFGCASVYALRDG